MKEIKQVFIKCHDNDFHSYYISALKSLFNYVDFFNNYKGYNKESLKTFIIGELNNLSQLQNGKNFPWEVKIFFNEEAKKVYEEEAKWGNSESAYMDIETYLITPGANIEQFIFNV